jgi:MYXO-CTERM domain-containing protein
MLVRRHLVALLGFLLAFAPPVFAQPASPVREYDVVLDTIALSGRNARIVFNLTNGDTGANALVQISQFTTNGTTGTTSTARGNVIGSLDTAILLDDRSAMTTQYIQTDAVLGTQLSFHVKTTDLHAAPGKPHDAFSFHVLNAQAKTPLVATSDPTRANAVFFLELGHTDPTERLTLFERDLYQSAYSWSATVTPVPEPAAAAAALVAIGALALLRRKVIR